MPWKNSLAGRVRRFLALRSTTSPPSASSTSGISALGSAWATEPHTVPRLRTWKCEMKGKACASSGTSRARVARHSTLACVAAAPTASMLPSQRTKFRSSVREMSISTLGCASRMLSTAISDWPPARIRASGPSALSCCTASSAVSART